MEKLLSASVASWAHQGAVTQFGSPAPCPCESTLAGTAFDLFLHPTLRFSTFLWVCQFLNSLSINYSLHKLSTDLWKKMSREESDLDQILRKE